MENILITGGLGFVGGRLSKRLGTVNQVTIASRKQVDEVTRQLHNATASVLHEDLLEKEKFPSKINTVIHLAALNEWDCLKYPSEAIRVNVDETRIILENAIATGVKNFIYFSTAHIYGSPLKGIISETDLPFPVHPYAITHRCAEDFVVAATLQKRIHGVVFRLSNSFGAPVLPTVNRWTLLTNDLAKQAIEKSELRLQSNGCQYRDFICLSDVENILFEMIKRGIGKYSKLVYNLGSGNSMRVVDMASRIAEVYKEIYGNEIEIHFPTGSKPSIEPGLELSINRLSEDGLQIHNDVRSEIRELLIFCGKNFKTIN